MGTKSDPGTYNCLAKAEDDEPIFVLLARDESAAGLVELWAEYAASRGVDKEKVAEAKKIASEMRAWRIQRLKGSKR